MDRFGERAIRMIGSAISNIRGRQVLPNAYGEAANVESLAWAAKFKLARGSLALDQLGEIRCGSCAAHTYPTAPAAVVALGAKLITWLFLFDDVYGEGREAKDTRELMSTLATYEKSLRSGRLPPGPSPFHHALVDLRAQALTLGAYSSPNRSRIPIETDHRFRRKSISDSGANRSPMPVGKRTVLSC